MKKIVSVLIFILITALCFGQSAKEKQDDAKPFVLGHIDEIPSKILGEKRILNIYLPDGYNKSDSVKYPVIYLLDGSADEDFIHVVGIVQFNNFPWIERVPKSIVVGIANIDRRKDLLIQLLLKLIKSATKLPENQKILFRL